MRLIDADALKECFPVPSNDMPKETYSHLLGLYAALDFAPPIDAVPRQKYEEDMENAFAHGYTDAESNFRKMIMDGELVEVVRCKDCKHKEKEQPGMVYCPMMVGSWVSDDHFCAWGERRTDGT